MGCCYSGLINGVRPSLIALTPQYMTTFTQSLLSQIESGDPKTKTVSNVLNRGVGDAWELVRPKDGAGCEGGLGLSPGKFLKKKTRNPVF